MRFSGRVFAWHAQGPEFNRSSLFPQKSVKSFLERSLKCACGGFGMSVLPRLSLSFQRLFFWYHHKRLVAVKQPWVLNEASLPQQHIMEEIGLFLCKDWWPRDGYGTEWLMVTPPALLLCLCGMWSGGDFPERRNVANKREFCVLPMSRKPSTCRHDCMTTRWPLHDPHPDPQVSMVPAPGWALSFSKFVVTVMEEGLSCISLIFFFLRKYHVV